MFDDFVYRIVIQFVRDQRSLAYLSCVCCQFRSIVDDVCAVRATKPFVSLESNVSSSHSKLRFSQLLKGNYGRVLQDDLHTASEQGLQLDGRKYSWDLSNLPTRWKERLQQTQLLATDSCHVLMYDSQMQLLGVLSFCDGQGPGKAGEPPRGGPRMFLGKLAMLLIKCPLCYGLIQLAIPCTTLPAQRLFDRHADRLCAPPGHAAAGGLATGSRAPVDDDVHLLRQVVARPGMLDTWRMLGVPCGGLLTPALVSQLVASHTELALRHLDLAGAGALTDDSLAQLLGLCPFLRTLRAPHTRFGAASLSALSGSSWPACHQSLHSSTACTSSTMAAVSHTAVRAALPAEAPASGGAALPRRNRAAMHGPAQDWGGGVTVLSRATMTTGGAGNSGRSSTLQAQHAQPGWCAPPPPPHLHTLDLSGCRELPCSCIGTQGGVGAALQCILRQLTSLRDLRLNGVPGAGAVFDAMRMGGPAAREADLLDGGAPGGYPRRRRAGGAAARMYACTDGSEGQCGAAVAAQGGVLAQLTRLELQDVEVGCQRGVPRSGEGAKAQGAGRGGESQAGRGEGRCGKEVAGRPRSSATSRSRAVDLHRSLRGPHGSQASPSVQGSLGAAAGGGWGGDGSFYGGGKGTAAADGGLTWRQVELLTQHCTSLRHLAVSSQHLADTLPHYKGRLGRYESPADRDVRGTQSSTAGGEGSEHSSGAVSPEPSAAPAVLGDTGGRENATQHAPRNGGNASPALPSLLHLSVGWGTGGALLLHFMRSSPYLASLTAHAGAGVGDWHLQKLAGSCCHLGRLELRGAQVSDEGLSAVLRHCTGLTSLTLHGCAGPLTDGLTLSPPLTPRPPAFRLRELHLSWSNVQLSDHGLMGLLSPAVAALHVLVLRGCAWVSDAGVWPALAPHAHTLRCLRLEDCGSRAKLLKVQALQTQRGAPKRENPMGICGASCTHTRTAGWDEHMDAAYFQCSMLRPAGPGTGNDSGRADSADMGASMGGNGAAGVAFMCQGVCGGTGEGASGGSVRVDEQDVRARVSYEDIGEKLTAGGAGGWDSGGFLEDVPPPLTLTAARKALWGCAQLRLVSLKGSV